MLRALVVLALMTLPVPLSGQLEVGTDMTITYTDFGMLSDGAETSSVTSVQFPNPRLRIGFFVTPRVSIEPSIRVNYGGSGGQSARSATLGTSLYYHFWNEETGNAPFVRVAGGLFTFDSTGRDSSTQFSAELGAGAKFRVADALLIRAEGSVGRTFEAGERPSSTEAGVAFGFSWYSG